MEISFDPVKRAKTLAERGLDFADAAAAFDSPTLTLRDDRRGYPEERFQTFGLVHGRVTMVVWTPTDAGIRVISMRKANDREIRRYRNRMD